MFWLHVLRKAWALPMVAALFMAITGTPAAAESARSRSGASISYCGLGLTTPDSVANMGGGGDTIMVDDPIGVYHYIYDNASPVSLSSHDRVIFRDIQPGELRFSRVGDHLVICHDSRGYELVLDNHYCRHKGLSQTDVPNGEIEELAFLLSGEIWLTDTLYAEAMKSPGAFPLPADTDYAGADVPSSGWRLRPFSQVLPEMDRPALTCQ